MIYYLLDQAEADLVAIMEYIAERNPAAAARVLQSLHKRWDLLADHPFSGKGRDDLRPGARCVVVGQYLSLYRVTDQGVEIVRVLHGRRDLAAENIEE
ncbi:MAG: type II toxin-antitoxin system RelE/ParE family toxin [Mesorhizobium sp.]